MIKHIYLNETLGEVCHSMTLVNRIKKEPIQANGTDRFLFALL
jgi:hypothetical protein